MHWPFLAPTVRVSCGGKTAQIEALNCFNSFLQPCTPPRCFSASSHVVQSRPALAAYHARGLLGDGSCTSRNPLAKSSQPKGESCRVSQVRVSTSSPQHAAPRRKWKERRRRQRASGKRDKGRLSDYRTVNIHLFPQTCTETVLLYSPWRRYRVPAPIKGLAIRSLSSQGHGDLKFNGDLVSCGLAREPFCAFGPISEERAALAGPIWTVLESRDNHPFNSIRFNSMLESMTENDGRGKWPVLSHASILGRWHVGSCNLVIICCSYVSGHMYVLAFVLPSLYFSFLFSFFFLS